MAIDTQNKPLVNVEQFEERAFPCLKVSQPIGDFYVASLNSELLCKITHFDVRRIMNSEREFESYLGIQRPVEPKRVKDLKNYVQTEDACFPTAIILSIPADCARFDEKTNTMLISNKIDVAEDESPIYFGNIAKVIDGQHRIEGLKDYKGPPFELNVSIFIEIDVSVEAQIFSTVNLEQTKVNKSIVYDLFALATHRSPQKTCHNIAVAMDKHSDSPFYQRIKRLGVSTEGRYNETITQATFAEALLKYISDDPKRDRNLYLKNSKPQILSRDKVEKIIFGNMFIDEKDLDITDVLWNYFAAVRDRWPQAWNYRGDGLMLNRTNGFKALMRFLPKAYLRITKPGGVPSKEDFLSVFNKINIADEQFNIENFKPGTSGESRLFRSLVNSGIAD